MTIHSLSTSGGPPSQADHARKAFLSGATLAAVQNVVDAPPASLAVLAAVNDCMTAGDLPHPVQARRSNVVAVLQRWIRYREVDAKQPVADLGIEKLDHSFAWNVFAIESALNDDPVWRFHYMRPPPLT